ncbi:flavoprotein [Rostrohypoxylon terebratum]|nr:flavoprotein [Rostrohypoxylon terebratum]
MDPPQQKNHKPPATDVIIVGGGLAGLCAALAAAENGASVHVLERLHGGGSTAISGGVVYAGGGTAAQVAAGYGDDTPLNMYRYLRHEVGDAVAERTLRRFCDESVARVKWLRGYGVRFAGTLCPFRTSYPTDRYSLYFSGNEKAYPFVEDAKPAPRGHRAVGVGGGMTGEVMWRALFDSAMRLGVRFEPASKVEQLLLDDTGRVSGVRYRALENTTWGFAIHRALSRIAASCHQMSMNSLGEWFDRQAHAIWDREAEDRTLNASAVILAAGSFTMNKSMMEQYFPWARRVAPLGTAGDDGSGIHLGQTAGGSVSHMDRISTWRLLYPPEALLEGIVVSSEGSRIAAEDLYGASLSDVMTTQFHGRAYLILGSGQREKAISQIREQTQMPWTIFIRYLMYWAYKKADSLDHLAQKLALNPEALKTTVNTYNNAIIRKEPDPVGKIGFRSVIAEGPFYGIDISLRPSGLLVTPALPLGGLRVDGESGMVLNEKGEKIEGLYAAGKNAVGVSSNRYVSGLALADCVFSGKQAGEHAAKAAVVPNPQ